MEARLCFLSICVSTCRGLSSLNVIKILSTLLFIDPPFSMMWSPLPLPIGAGNCRSGLAPSLTFFPDPPVGPFLPLSIGPLGLFVFHLFYLSTDSPSFQHSSPIRHGFSSFPSHPPLIFFITPLHSFLSLPAYPPPPPLPPSPVVTLVFSPLGTANFTPLFHFLFTHSLFSGFFVSSQFQVLPLFFILFPSPQLSLPLCLLLFSSFMPSSLLTSLVLFHGRTLYQEYPFFPHRIPLPSFSILPFLALFGFHLFPPPVVSVFSFFSASKTLCYICFSGFTCFFSYPGSTFTSFSFLHWFGWEYPFSLLTGLSIHPLQAVGFFSSSYCLPPFPLSLNFSSSRATCVFLTSFNTARFSFTFRFPFRGFLLPFSNVM